MVDESNISDLNAKLATLATKQNQSTARQNRETWKFWFKLFPW